VLLVLSACATGDEGSGEATGGEQRADLRTRSALGRVHRGWENYNEGEVFYVEQGAYEGLTLHLLAAGTNEPMSYAGWIEPSE